MIMPSGAAGLLTATLIMPYDKNMQNEAAAHFREMAGAVLREGARLSFRASGRSMSPFIRDNDRVIVEPPSGRLRIGDVILFASSGQQLILHRIVKKRGDGYVTRGDSTCHHDGTVQPNAVLGRAVHIVGGLNFHLRFPLSTLVAHALRLRDHPMLFNMLRMPGRLLLGRLRSKDHLQQQRRHRLNRRCRLRQIDIEPDSCNNNNHEFP